MKDSWRGRSRIRNEWEKCPVSSRANSWGNTLFCWKRHDIHKAFPTFGIYISSATYIFEGFNLVINILKTDTNTHRLTVPKENIKGNVKYSKLVEKCIYVSPNKNSVKDSKYDYYWLAMYLWAIRCYIYSKIYQSYL